MSRRGLSLMELVLALGATGFLGLAIAAMLQAVAYGSQSADGLQALATRHQVAAARVGTALRSARQIVRATPTELTIWYDDLNADGVVDSTELMWLRYIGADRELRMERADLSAPGVFGVPVEPGPMVNYPFIRWGFDFVNWLESVVWTRDATAFSYTLDHADPLLATLITFTITLEENGQSDTMVHTVKLRN